MKKILLGCFLCVVNYTFAASLPSVPIRDTAIRAEGHQLNKNEFLDKYSRDDSSRALIQFFFFRRHFGIRSFSGGAAATVLSALAIVPTYHKANSDDATVATFALFGLGFIFSTGIALLSIGAAVWLKYSRKRLSRLLNDYFSGNHIPHKISRSRTYKSFLYYGKPYRKGRKEVLPHKVLVEAAPMTKN